MTDHITWKELPDLVRSAVTARTGPVADAIDVPHGYNCQHASILTTPTGRVFVKAALASEAAAFHDREEQAAPPTGTAPALRWRARCDGWDVLGFDAIPGARHARLDPGTPDLGPLAELLQQTTTAPTALPAYADQWTGIAAAAELALLDGRTLVHGDINPHNVLVAAGRAWLVDWATATRGPAWVDVAEAAIRLMEDGHTARDAHAWACRVPAWRDAEPGAVAAWVEMRCRAWEARIGPTAATPSNARHQALAAEAAPAAAR